MYHKAGQRAGPRAESSMLGTESSMTCTINRRRRRVLAATLQPSSSSANIWEGTVRLTATTAGVRPVFSPRSEPSVPFENHNLTLRRHFSITFSN